MASTIQTERPRAEVIEVECLEHNEQFLNLMGCVTCAIEEIYWNDYLKRVAESENVWLV